MNPPESNPTFEAALGEVAWLRRLAVELVGPLWADDVVQDTLVAAWQRETQPSDPRRWLARVARNLASKRRRGEARRGERQAQVAHAVNAATAPDGSPIGARLRVQQELLRAIGELDASDRDLVVRRFLDDCTPAALASELGLPAATVRSRLSRALAKLRNKLDNEFGQADWLGALVPWALPNAIPLGLPHTLPPPNGSAAALSKAAPAKVWAASLFGVLGGAAMGKWMGAVVLAVVGVLVWQFGFEQGDAQATRTAAGPPVERAVAKLSVEPQRAEAEVPREQTPKRMAITVPPVANEQAMRTANFTILDGPTQRPLAGAELVQLDEQVMANRLGDLGGDFGAVRAKSDASGALHVSAQAPSEASFLLRRAGYAELFLSTSLLGDNGSDYALEMWPATRWTVCVTDAEGAPVVGAVVNALAETDELAPGKDLSAWGMGLRDDWDGRLRRAAAAPTDGYGETELLGFNEHVPLRIEVLVAGALVLTCKDAKSAAERVEIRLPASSSIVGTLHDSQGAPLANTSLFLGEFHSVLPMVLSTKTDAMGRFAFAQVPMGEDGERLDWIRGADHAMQTLLPSGELLNNTHLDWKAAVDGVLELELQSELALSISGSVFEANGAPVKTDGYVWVRRNGRPIATKRSHDGQFRVPGLVRGEYELSFSVGPSPNGTRVVAQAGDEGVRLEARASGELTLKLVPAPGSSAETKIGSNVMVIGWRDPGGVSVLSSNLIEPQTFEPEQELKLSGCVPGRYRFVVMGLSGLIGSADVEVLADMPNAGTIPMQPEARVDVDLPVGLLDEVTFLVAGRHVGWRETHNEPAIVPPGPVTVRWVRADGTTLETTVVALAGETVTAHFD